MQIQRNQNETNTRTRHFSERHTLLGRALPDVMKQFTELLYCVSTKCTRIPHFKESAIRKNSVKMFNRKRNQTEAESVCPHGYLWTVD